MGQQQLLLIVVGVIVVGIAILGGILLFRQSAIDTKRENLIDDGVSLATMAQSYYRKPITMGGGGRKFTGWQIPSVLQLSGNGSFQIEGGTPGAQSFVLVCTGNEIATGTDSVKVKITVYPTTYQTQIIH